MHVTQASVEIKYVFICIIYDVLTSKNVYKALLNGILGHERRLYKRTNNIMLS